MKISFSTQPTKEAHKLFDLEYVRYHDGVYVSTVPTFVGRIISHRGAVFYADFVSFFEVNDDTEWLKHSFYLADDEVVIKFKN